MEGCCNTILTGVWGVNLMNEYAECASAQDVGGVYTYLCLDFGETAQKSFIFSFFLFPQQVFFLGVGIRQRRAELLQCKHYITWLLS